MLLLLLRTNQSGPTPPTPTDLTVSGAGPGFNLFRKRQDDERRKLRRAIEMAMGLVDDLEPEVREEAKAIIAVASVKPASQINQIDFTPIFESQRIMEAILVHFERLKAAKMAEDEEDEEIALIILN
jgi:hypothetical protein